MDPNSPVKCYIAALSGHPIGFIQSYPAMACGGGWWEDETDPGTHGIDQFLADGNALGRGLGTRMVRAFTRKLFAHPSVTRVQVDPSPQNARAIGCYLKAGFVPIQEVVTPDGPALLMVAMRKHLSAGDLA
jgi:RimJ/RimL family protein N-acetyltransferase